MSNLDDLTTDQMLRQILLKVNIIEASMSGLQTKVVAIKDNVSRLNKQVHDLQNIVNAHEQELRNLSV
jgi:hypothetical protein